MTTKAKPFLSKNNPLKVELDNRENFSLRYLLPYYCFSWLIIFISLFLIYLPKPFRRLIGSATGLFIMHSNTKRSHIVMTNLSLCFKSKTRDQLKKIHDEYFKNLGNTIIDMPSLWWRSNKSLQKNCTIINEHYINNELLKGKGVILLTPHCVSLDFGGRSISKYPIISIYKPFRNKLLNWFIGRSRSKNTDNVIVYPRENLSFKKIVQALKKPIVFYYIGDEDLGLKNSEFANFFDEKKSTLISISKIAALSKATVIPCINHYCPSKDKYITYVDKPLEKFPTEQTRDDALIINRAFEKLINRDLNQYMWSLRLFQTRPNGHKYPYVK